LRFLFGPSGETRLHLRLRAQIKVATSVCTGGSNMPPAYCDLIVRVAPQMKKAEMAKAISAFLACCIFIDTMYPPCKIRKAKCTPYPKRKIKMYPLPKEGVWNGAKLYFVMESGFPESQ
jgi:hypothetical protein